MTSKILFITSNRLGDAVLSTGLVENIGEKYGENSITVACGALAAPLFEGNPYVKEVITLRKQKHAGHWVRLWKQVITTPWTMVVDLRNSAVSRLIWAGGRYIHGPHIDKGEHKVIQNARVMKLDNVPDPVLHFSDTQLNWAKAKIDAADGQGLLAVAPSANWIAKTWPSDNFVELIKRLTASDGILPDAKVAIFGAPGEEDIAKPVLHTIPAARLIDVIGNADPGQAGALISKADLFVGNDSGLMHMAAATGIPTVGLFGPTNDLIYGPWGKNATYLRTPESLAEHIDYDGYHPTKIKKSLMTSLTVDMVEAHINDFWKSL